MSTQGGNERRGAALASALPACSPPQRSPPLSAIMPSAVSSGTGSRVPPRGGASQKEQGDAEKRQSNNPVEGGDDRAAAGIGANPGRPAASHLAGRGRPAGPGEGYAGPGNKLCGSEWARAGHRRVAEL